jgi:hypothetical protein
MVLQADTFLQIKDHAHFGSKIDRGASFQLARLFCGQVGNLPRDAARHFASQPECRSLPMCE